MVGRIVCTVMQNWILTKLGGRGSDLSRRNPVKSDADVDKGTAPGCLKLGESWYILSDCQN